MVKIFCAEVGKRGVFSINAHPAESVSCLVGEVRESRHYSYRTKVQFFLAKTSNGAWMTEEEATDDSICLNKLKVLHGYEIVGEHFGGLCHGVNILVKIPKTIECPVGWGSNHTTALQDYQKVGELIQRDCGEYSRQILATIDEFYQLNTRVLPFICVQGSSGVGKSQLAFALKGHRPWFYAPVCSLGMCSQDIYQCFCDFSSNFRSVMAMDLPGEKSENAIFDPSSTFYENEKLWTYGWICALLKSCRLDENQQPRMIRFEAMTILEFRQSREYSLLQSS
ncbi:hypothetical protein P3T76_006568 [Phytophthora citrophthora]|uniref:Crinkler (CRN) family protein n=1 Tax=Phytophthora citrophthora TaxID=4793 RepID=A0AAD9LNB5_9STRA|nr:hypothetical protein P3T76_006568 [Phytophthora citrophthora]